MSDSPSFADLTRRLDLALTVDLIATPTPLHLSSSPDVEIVRQQMAQTGFDILPCDKDIASYWVRRHCFSRTRTPLSFDLWYRQTSSPRVPRFRSFYDLW